MSRFAAGWILLLLCAPAPALAGDLLPAPPGLSARAIASRVEDIFRGKTSYVEATMIVRSPRLSQPRRVRLRMWDDRPHRRSFIRILAPPKDKGMGFLKLHPNLWNYIPRVERTVRIPPSMMLQSWMGSDFSNDDLVRDSSQLDDYDHTLLGLDPGLSGAEGAPSIVLEYRPHEDAPVVWGRIVTWVDARHFAPLRQDFYDEDGVRLRTMRFSEIHEVQDRPYPHRWSIKPLDKQGHETIIEISKVRFDQHFDDSIFTKRHLIRGDR